MDEGLSYVASAVGKPLYADKMTETCKGLSYAKICVEVDADLVLPEAFDVALANGTCFPVKSLCKLSDSRLYVERGSRS